MATEVISREAQQQYPRWPVAAAKAVRVDLGPAGGGHIVNVSLGGIRVKSLAPLRRESELPLCIYVPELSPMQCSGVVVWSKPDGAAGLRFTKMADDQKAILGSWLKDLEQASGDSAFQRDEFVRTTAQVSAMKLNNADALRFIARRVVQVSSASGVAIALGKPENLVCMARLGEAPELGTSIRLAGLVGECIRGRKMTVCHDAATDPRSTERKEGSELIVPMLVNGELRGLIQAVSPKAHVFDVKCMETVEKLADAAVFVTHNIMPPRRVPSATTMSKAANMVPPMTSVSEPGGMKAYTRIANPASIAAPAASVTPASAPATSKPLPVVSVAEAPVETAVAARIAASPMAKPHQPATAAAKVPPAKPAYEFDMAEFAKARQANSARTAAYHSQPRRSVTRMLAIPAAVAVVAIPLALHFRHTNAVPTVAAATTAPAPTVSSIAPVFPTPVESRAISHSTTATSATAAKPTSSVASVTHEKKTTLSESAPRKAGKLEQPVEPEVAPLVLASGVPVARQEDESPEVPAPTAPRLTMKTTAAMPGISLPTTSAPKLAVPVSKPLTGGTLIQRVSPIYPQIALAQNIEGQVQLKATITTKGTVGNIRRISGHPLLMQAAVDAVQHWRYDPFKSGGEPIAGEVNIILNFKIPR